MALGLKDRRRRVEQDPSQELEPLIEWAIGERCGITMPTRFAYRGAGYYPMAKGQALSFIILMKYLK